MNKAEPKCVNAHDRCYEGGPCPHCEVPASKPTNAQIVARDRNWYIVRLRSLWCIVGVLRNPESVKTIRELIDVELAALKAEPQQVREDRRRAMLNTGDYDALQAEVKKTEFKRPSGKIVDYFPF